MIIRNPLGQLAQFNIEEFVSPVLKDISALQIPLEIFQKEDHWLVKAYVPGVAKEDIHVDVDGGKLVISAVRPKPEDKVYLTEVEYGEMKTKVCVSGLSYIKKESVSASYTDGVLCIVVKKDVDALPYKVEIA